MNIGDPPLFATTFSCPGRSNHLTYRQLRCNESEMHAQNFGSHVKVRE